MVSPMQRAMQTAILMFKDHPNANKIKFMVTPACREIMHTSNDINCDVNKLIERYGPGAKDAEGLTFDFSMLLMHG